MKPSENEAWYSICVVFCNGIYKLIKCSISRLDHVQKKTFIS